MTTPTTRRESILADPRIQKAREEFLEENKKTYDALVRLSRGEGEIKDAIIPSAQHSKHMFWLYTENLGRRAELKELFNLLIYYSECQRRGAGVNMVLRSRKLCCEMAAVMSRLILVYNDDERLDDFLVSIYPSLQ